MTKREQNIINRFGKLIFNEGLSNDCLVQIIELAGDAMNLETISDYSRRTGISYNGVKKCREIRKVRNVKFVVDNE